MTAKPSLKYRPIPRLLRAGTCLALIAILAASTACARRKHFVPRQVTPQAQLEYAMRFEQRYRSPLLESSREENFSQALAAYEQVLIEYPEETYWTSRARLHIAMINDAHGRTSLALRQYEELLSEFPEDDDIQINCLYGAAVIYDHRKQYEKAQEYYSKILKRYAGRTDGNFPSVVRNAQIRYHQARTR